MRSNENPRWTAIKRTFRRIARVALLLLFIFLAVFIYWKYFYTYSDGYRAGLLQKFSRKGNVFKTYEGEIILSSITSNRNTVLASEKFLFSVTDENLAAQLDTLQGQYVIVYYRQKNGKLFWRGDTPYFVQSVQVKE